MHQRMILRALFLIVVAVLPSEAPAQFAPGNGVVDPTNPSSATSTTVNSIYKIVDHYYFDCLKKKWVWVSREWLKKGTTAFSSDEFTPVAPPKPEYASPDIKQRLSGPPPGAETSPSDSGRAYNPTTGQNFAKEADGSWIDVKTGKKIVPPKLCPCPEPSTTPQPPPPNNEHSSLIPAPPLKPFDQRILDIHNQERFAVRVPPLRWNFQLQQDATTYAQQLAVSHQLTHAPREGRGIERENLLQYNLGWGLDRMMQSWTSEKRDFMPGYFPNVARDGDWLNVAHYTQMIWPTTTDIGCGTAEGGGYGWLVCRYSPGGNKDRKPVGMASGYPERG